MQFYTIYPLIAIGVFKLTKEPLDRRWLLLRIVIVLAIFSLAYRHLFQSIPGPVITTLEFCDSLFIGCALKLLEPFYPKIKQPYQWIFASICLLIAFLILKFSTTLIDRKLTLICWDKPLYINVVFILIFFAAYYKLKPLNWFLENPFICWMGRISYAFYLWHYPIRYFLPHLGPTPYFGFFSSLTCEWLATTIMAALSTYTVEKYFLNLRYKLGA